MMAERWTMPLKDHFQKPFTKKLPWDAFHAAWSTKIVESLMCQLPKGYVAFPNNHLGYGYEIDVGSWEHSDAGFESDSPVAAESGMATVATAPPRPSWVMDADFQEVDQYEVRVYDDMEERRLVAAIEIVSPSNKDRPDHRLGFANKCANLLKSDVAVSMIDIVTSRNFNLGRELFELVGRPAPRGEAPPLYCSTFRPLLNGRGHKVEVWEQPLAIGQPLPKFPLWLSDTLCLQFDLEESYEATCRVWSIR